jgi:Winged helix DNA-binding domain
MAVSGAVPAERFRAQLLVGPPAGDVGSIVDRLLAVQAQDARAARLAIRSRSVGLTAAHVDRALDDRSHVVTWLNRGTLHLVRSEDYPWLHAVATPQLHTTNATRLRQEGVSGEAAERGVRTIVQALAEDGPLARQALRARLDTVGVPTAGQALVQVLFLASLRGLVVRGPVVGREQAFVLVRDWLGEPPPVDRDVALRELARRYLAGHGPAGARDLARWAGLALRDARAGLAAIARELVERDDGLAQLAAVGRQEAAVPPPRLLGGFDPLLLGWASREAIVGDGAGIVTSNGVFRPFVLVDGRAVGVWRLERRDVVVEPFASTPARDLAAVLEAEAADVVRFLGA